MIEASQPHYRAHLDPITALVDIPDDVALVASHRDLVSVRRRRPRKVILAQHGAGQSYGGDPKAAHVAAYPGGDDNHDVGLFLVPNEHAARRWRERYPAASVRVVGCPALDTRPAREPGPFTIAIAFHWDARFVPEARSGLTWFAPAVQPLGKLFRLIGHGHPRRVDLARFYRRNGVELVTDVDEVFRRADLLIADNTSVLFEFAATGRPVVVMNPPWYRLDIDHGLRFWDAVPGPAAANPCELGDAILEALSEPPTRREAAVSTVYAHRSGAAPRAAAAIVDWLS